MSATKSLDEYKEYYKSAIQPSYDKRVANLNETAEKQKQENTDLYNTAVAKTEESYDDDYELNSVQRLVNERQLKENMANLGLTNSGLYNANILANEKAYETANRQIDEAKQKELNSLADELASATSNIDTALKTELATLEQDFEKQATDYAQSRYITDLEENIKAAQDTISELYGKNTILQRLVKNLYVISEPNGILNRNAVINGKLSESGVTAEKKGGYWIFTDQNSGYTSKFPVGVNPYTNDSHKDLYVNGVYDEKRAFSNGYQPRYIGNNKLKAYKKDGKEATYYINGKEQTVWTYDNGKTLWVWDGTVNDYKELT